MASLLTRRRFISGVIAGPALAGLYAWRVEPTWVEFFHRDLPIANLPAGLAGKTLVHLSDIHIGPQVSDDYLIGVFQQITALAPAIVVHTGDLITYAGLACLPHVRRVLAHFPSGSLGTCASLGNHDYGHFWSSPDVADQLTSFLTNVGCTVLRNQTATVGGLHIIGADDLWSGRFTPQAELAKLKPDTPALVLSHNPDSCDEPVWGDYRGWILSGHTHGGQCKPPFLPPPMLPVKNRRYTAGEFALSGERRLYINRGLGHLLRVRFNARPEVTVFTLTPA